jgi:DNA polymerase-3 subunit gamma/tau
MLSTSAFNALLKTLEEPPSHVKFIFATTEAQKVPSTITFRCQRFEFKPISESILRSKLLEIAQAEKIEIEPLALEAII